METTPSIANVVAQLDRLSARIDVLEQRLDGPVTAGLGAPLPAAPPPPGPASAVTVPIGLPAPPVPVADVAAAPAAAVPVVASKNDSTIDSEAFLKWAGVGLVLLAMIFLVSTAIQRGWIGPELQLAGAVAVGAALVAASLKMHVARRSWGLALGLGGVGVLAASAILGQRELGLYSQTVSTIALGAVAIVGFWLATRLGRAAVAVLAVVVALVAPAPHAVWIGAAWYAALIVATLALSIQQNWLSLRLWTVALSVLPLFALAVEAANETHRLDLPVAWISVVVALAAYWWATTIGADDEVIADADEHSTFGTIVTRADLDRLLHSLDHRFAVGLPIVAWLVTGQLFTSQTENGTWWWACAVAAIGGLAAIGGYAIGRLREVTFVAHIIGASVLLSIGVAGLVDGSTLLVAVVAQALGLGWLAQRTGDPLAGLNAIVVGGVGAVLTGVGLIDAIGNGAPMIDDLIHLVVLLAAAGLAWIGRPSDWSTLIGAVAWIGGLAWITSVFSQMSQGQMVVSMFWAAMGASALIVGMRRRASSIANVGLATLGLTVAKLLTVDLDTVDTMWRAGLFFVVGLGFLKLGLTIADLDKSDEDEDSQQPEALLTAQ